MISRRFLVEIGFKCIGKKKWHLERGQLQMQISQEEIETWTDADVTKSIIFDYERILDEAYAGDDW